ncbi:MAG: hypothetical protein KBS93_03420 [Flavobacteriaceae bacterium]|nr:hypothetical protein [Candidatus Onthonaster equi]
MKKLFYSLFALCSLTLSAQDKTFSFDKKVNYEIKVPEEYLTFLSLENLNINFYSGKEGLLGHSEGALSFYGFNTTGFFTTNNKFFDVKVNSLENILSIDFPQYYYNGLEQMNQPYNDNFFGKIQSFKKLNTTENYNGYTCNNFEFEVLENDELKTNTVCIDEKNTINNAKFLIPNQKVNGLIVKLVDHSSNGLFIKSVNNSSLKVTFDEKKSIEDYNQELAKLKAEYESNYTNEIVDSVATDVEDYLLDNRYDDPILAYYNYANSDNEKVNSAFNTIVTLPYSIMQQDSDYDNEFDYDRLKALKTSEASTKQIVKQFSKNGLINKSEAKELNNIFKKLYKDAKDFKLIKGQNLSDLNNEAMYIADSAAVSFEDYIFDEYSSQYKAIDIKDISLAIDNETSESFLKMAPKHCQDLKTNVPAFSDKNLKNLVYNYVGQVCDLYIYHSGNVGLVSTIDALRKSVLEIYMKYDSISKEDKETLKIYLDSLD